MLISKQIIDDAIVRTVAKYSTDTNVIGIFLIGSAATETMDESSDIDFIIVTNEAGGKSRDQFIDESGIAIEVLFNTELELESYLRNDVASLYRNTSIMLSVAKIVHDPAKLLQKFIDQAVISLTTKSVMSDADNLMHRYSIIDFLSDAKRERDRNAILAKALVSEFLIRNTIEAIIRLHGSYFVEPRRLANHLGAFDPSFKLLLEAYYESPSQLQIDSLSEIASYTLNQLGGQLPENWSLAQTPQN